MRKDGMPGGHQSQTQIAMREHIDLLAGGDHLVHVLIVHGHLFWISWREGDLRAAATQIQGSCLIRLGKAAQQEVDGEPTEDALVRAIHDFHGIHIHTELGLGKEISDGI